MGKGRRGRRSRSSAGCRVEGGGRPAILQGRRSRVLLAWLALHPGSHAPRELAGWFGLHRRGRRPHEPAQRAHRAAPGLGIASRLLAADRERVALTGARVDAPAFVELAIAGRLAEAEALCRSELLAGVDDDLVSAARAEHERRLAELLARLPGAWTRNAVVGDSRSVQVGSRRTVSIVATLLLSLGKRASRSC